MSLSPSDTARDWLPSAKSCSFKINSTRFLYWFAFLQHASTNQHREDVWILIRHQIWTDRLRDQDSSVTRFPNARFPAVLGRRGLTTILQQLFQLYSPLTPPSPISPYLWNHCISLILITHVTDRRISGDMIMVKLILTTTYIKIRDRDAWNQIMSWLNPKTTDVKFFIRHTRLIITQEDRRPVLIILPFYLKGRALTCTRSYLINCRNSRHKT